MSAWLICGPLLTFSGGGGLSCPGIYWTGCSLKCISWHMFILSWSLDLLWQCWLLLYPHKSADGHNVKFSEKRKKKYCEILQCLASICAKKKSLWHRECTECTCQITHRLQIPSNSDSRNITGLTVCVWCSLLRLCGWDRGEAWIAATTRYVLQRPKSWTRLNISLESLVWSPY